MSDTPIENYGVIGNMHTVALVSMTGVIDWFCPRQFDDSSIFGAILDQAQGGYFCFAPDHPTKYKQFYWPETNVLVTRFICAEGVLEVTDFMPVGITPDEQERRWLIRRAKMVRGTFPVKIDCRPAFNYARDTHDVQSTAYGALFTSDEYSFALCSDVSLTIDDGAAVRHWQMTEGDIVTLCLAHHPQADMTHTPPTIDETDRLFRLTVDYWRTWLAQCTYQGRWREMVYRSALAMKLLTYEPTGAIIAAPTTSLPETIGGVRNWDYRYSWLRDAAFTLYGFLRIGFTKEAGAFIDWLQARIQESEGEPPLQIMYTIEGAHHIPERTLDHLAGYADSQPVRIGNKASTQLQMDIYGELMDSIYLYNKYGKRISYDLWVSLRAILNWVADNWHLQDKGIWEVRGQDQAFVYSRLMCWVALDRGVRLARKRSFPAPRQYWLAERDKIYEEIIAQGWNEEIKAFTQTYGGNTLDASNLIMPLVFFMSPHDPRIEQTIDAIMRPPDDGGLVLDSLVYRYNTEAGIDGIDGDEGTFNMCTFWLVEALARTGRIEDARLMFEQTLGYANHLGLYAEETGTRGQALGNFPQGFTHLSLISAAYNLDRILTAGKMP